MTVIGKALLKPLTPIGTRSLSLPLPRTGLSEHAFMMGEVKYFSTQSPLTGARESPDTQNPKKPSDSKDSDVEPVVSEEELQEEWKALERRVSNRKPRMNDGSVPSGRGNRNSSAWDAENVQ